MLAPVLTVAATAAPVDDALQRAASLEAIGRYDEAATSVRPFANLGDPRVSLALGRLTWQLGRVDEAVAWFDQATSQGGGLAARRALAWALVRQAYDLPRAQREFQALLADDPYDSDAAAGLAAARAASPRSPPRVRQPRDRTRSSLADSWLVRFLGDHAGLGLAVGPTVYDGHPTYAGATLARVSAGLRGRGLLLSGAYERQAWWLGNASAPSREVDPLLATPNHRLAGSASVNRRSWTPAVHGQLVFDSGGFQGLTAAASVSWTGLGEAWLAQSVGTTREHGVGAQTWAGWYVPFEGGLFAEPAARLQIEDGVRARFRLAVGATVYRSVTLRAWGAVGRARRPVDLAPFRVDVLPGDHGLEAGGAVDLTTGSRGGLQVGYRFVRFVEAEKTSSHGVLASVWLGHRP